MLIGSVCILAPLIKSEAQTQRTGHCHKARQSIVAVAFLRFNCRLHMYFIYLFIFHFYFYFALLSIAEDRAQRAYSIFIPSTKCSNWNAFFFFAPMPFENVNHSRICKWSMSFDRVHIDFSVADVAWLWIRCAHSAHTWIFGMGEIVNWKSTVQNDFAWKFN